jgi:manganese/iron transport system permease protein
VDLSILGYQFMQNAILASFLGGVACAVVGVFVVLWGLPLVGVAMAHAAFAGALLALWLGFDPLIGALILSLVAAAAIGPLADRADFHPETSLGVIFAIVLGLAFLFMGLMSGSRATALELLWGSLLTTTRTEVIWLAVIALVLVAMVALFYKEIKATLLDRHLALASGVGATAIFYGVLFFTGATVTLTLRSLGGLLVFALILNPAAAAYQLTYRLKWLFLIAAGFGVLSGWGGLGLSYAFNLPSGAMIVLVSSAIFLLCLVFSPKRRRGKGKSSPGGK